MSTFDNNEKDNMLYELIGFLDNHSLSELLEIIAYVIKAKEESYE